MSHWTCDEASGVRYDSNNTSNNDLTDNNTVASVTGKLNNACDFEKTNTEYFSILDASQVNLDLSATGYSVSFWINPESLGGWSIVNKFTSGPAGYRIFTDASDRINTYWWNTAGDETGARTNTALTGTGSWDHWVVTVDPSLVQRGFEFYKNGTRLTATTTIGGNFGGTPGGNSEKFGLGASNLDTTPTSYFDGLLDEITFFNRVLTPTEVTTLYNGNAPLSYSSTSEATSTPTTTSSTVDMAITNFALGIIIVYLSIWFIAYIYNSITEKNKQLLT